jgi:hypothetical protein
VPGVSAWLGWSAYRGGAEVAVKAGECSASGQAGASGRGASARDLTVGVSAIAVGLRLSDGAGCDSRSESTVAGSVSGRALFGAKRPSPPDRGSGGSKGVLGGVRGLSVSLARRVNQLVFRRGRVIADRWHGRALSTPRAVRHALVYLFGNYRKHEQPAGGVVDPFSSAPYFPGFLEFAQGVPAAPDLRRIAGIELARGSPVLEPRSWLLRAGWRRHGLISIREAPRSH